MMSKSTQNCHFLRYDVIRFNERNDLSGISTDCSDFLFNGNHRELYIELSVWYHNMFHFKLICFIFDFHCKTSHTVSFTLYLLARNPQSQRKLQAEIDAVMGDSSTLLPEHISQMKYLANVVKESLRYWLYIIGIYKIYIYWKIQKQC